MYGRKKSSIIYVWEFLWASLKLLSLAEEKYLSSVRKDDYLANPFKIISSSWYIFFQCYQVNFQSLNRL